VNSRADEIAGRARSLIGTAYRPKGRSPLGLDCVGLAALALAVPAAAVPRAYDRRTESYSTLDRVLREHGFQTAGRTGFLPGDLLLFEVKFGQLHLGISTGLGFVHADAGLRRVVERPFPAPWPIAGIWRAATPSKQERDSWPPSS
jgi:cell wall-associated NlpC family hydrolase